MLPPDDRIPGEWPNGRRGDVGPACPLLPTCIRMRPRRSIGCMLALVVVTRTAAQTPADRKAQFSLFSPTPREYRRDISPERPDATQNPPSD